MTDQQIYDLLRKTDHGNNAIFAKQGRIALLVY